MCLISGKGTEKAKVRLRTENERPQKVRNCITFDQIKQHTPNTDLSDHITHQEIAGNQLHSVVSLCCAVGI